MLVFMRKRIGNFLVEKGYLNEHQVLDIRRHSEKTGLRFGEAALELGLLSKEQLTEVFGPHFAVDYYHIEPRFLPPATRDLFTPEEMIRLGVIGLGEDKTEIKVGFLDPGREEAVHEVKRLIGERRGPQRLKIFLVLPDQFLAALKEGFRVPDDLLLKADPADLDPHLREFLAGAA